MEEKYDSSRIGPAQAGLFRTSDEIREDVEELISLNDAVQPKDIEVSVQDGTVRLSGRVRDRVAFEEAEQAARSVMGVTGVQNELEIAQ